MVFYAFMATSGSALGCLILYLVSKRAGARALRKFSEAKQRRVKNWIERYDAVSVLVATLLPPPFPFKLFVVTAGVFRFSLVRFMLAIVVGRGIRFLLVGYFAMRYGAEAKQILMKYYPWIGLALVAAILLFVLIKRWVKRGTEAVEQSLEPGS
jgi:membrane protein YqaA with SNARE-associated domain